jgi:hypothetical protein
MKTLLKKTNFELKHKIIYFILVILATIAVTRIFVMIKDPNIFFMGYELHHFYYGVILLIITNMLMLFGKENFKAYLLLSAVSIGLIIDELSYVAGGFGNKTVYLSTLPGAIIFAGVILLIIILINYFSYEKRKK